MKKIRIILLILLIAVISGGGFWGWRYIHLSTTLPIHVVKVVGEYQFVDQQILQKTVMPYVATGFFNVNIRGAELALLQIPGVSLASLRRVWPDKIEIQVSEKKAQATLPDGQIYAVDGSVFMPFHVQPGNKSLEKSLSQLPVFAGAVEDLPEIAAFYHSAEFLLMKNGFHIDFVGCDGLGSWTLGVRLSQAEASGNPSDNHDSSGNESNNESNKSANIQSRTPQNNLGSITIVLGRDHLIEKLTRFSKNYSILEKTNQNKIPTLIDLRYNLGFAAEYSS